MTHRRTRPSGTITAHRDHLPRLHVLTDTRGGRDPLDEVRIALDAGVRAIQVRAKEATDREALAMTRAVLELARGPMALVIVDDRLDVALLAGAHGVHLGATDLPVCEARAITPPGFILGATVRDGESARSAEAAGATYLGVGPAFATATKPGLPDPLGPSGIAAVSAATRLPVIAIGGVTPDLVPPLLAAGAHGVAVVSALSASAEPAAVAAELVALTEQVA